MYSARAGTNTTFNLRSFPEDNTTTGSTVAISAATPNAALDSTLILAIDSSTTPDLSYASFFGVGFTGLTVGAGSAPNAMLDVRGAAVVTGNLTVDTTTLVVDATNNRVGVGTASPIAGHALQVVGSVYATGLTVSASQPVFNFATTGTTGKGRLTSLVGNWFGMTTNLSFDGSNWQADDTSLPGWVFKLDARNSSIFDRFEVGRIAPGATPAAAYTSHLAITGAGSIVLGSAALATTATDGFLYIPPCAGTPTGTPTAHTGRAPLVIDTTNNKLCAYFGGAWRSVTLT
jgi:hypothetical protein